MAESTQVLGALRRDCERDSLLALHRAADQPAAPSTWPSPVLDYLADDDLPGTLRRRRSHRFFSDEPIEPAAITTMIRSAREADHVIWPAEAEASPLDFLVVARNVTGLPPAVYRDVNGAVQPIAALPGRDGLSGMVLQPEFALAAALLLVVGSLQDALATAGSHGHRILLERSGAASESAWLTAVHRGLTGSIFAGFLPSALKSLAAIDGFRRTQLLALAIGHPDSPTMTRKGGETDDQ